MTTKPEVVEKPTPRGRPLDVIPKRGKWDWAAIRIDYIVHGLSRAEIVQKHEVSLVRFQAHAKQGEWDALRQDVQDRMRNGLSGLPVVADTVLDAVDAQWRQRYRELEQMAVYIQRYMAAHGDEMKPGEINRLTQAERNIVQMQRLLMGESTENLGLVDQAIEKVLVIVEKYVPSQDRERLHDDIARTFGNTGPRALLPPAA